MQEQAVLPLLVGLSSTTSSCIKLAVWIISVISASLLCFSVMSLQAENTFQYTKTQFQILPLLAGGCPPTGGHEC